MLLDDLNSEQRAAACQTEGAVMIVAGAGSGKTRTLTYRVAHLLECGAKPWEILVLTFTNKAADEMKERIIGLVGKSARYIFMGTFHSVFSKILRLEAEHTGYLPNYSIYSTSDSKSLLKKIIKEYDLDYDHLYKPDKVLGRISKAKSQLITSAEYFFSDLYKLDLADGLGHMADIYREYDTRMKQGNAMDFDDLLLNMYLLLKKSEETRMKYQQMFKYIMVDEYQDTNRAQYIITNMLAAGHGNICVVGDDAQSIYAFRGADINNILDFRKHYGDTHTFKLEKNYRSSGNIVEAANSVIDKNKRQIKKNVWTDNPEGEKIGLVRLSTDREEADFVAMRIRSLTASGDCSLKDIAVLYRRNRQSRSIEESLRLKNIKYLVMNNTSFYERKEVKDALAWLALVVNNRDNQAFERAVSSPKRGIGETTLAKLNAMARERGLSLFDAATNTELLQTAFNYGTIKKLQDFCGIICAYSAKCDEADAFELGSRIIEASGLKDCLRMEKTQDSEDRIANIDELIDSMQSFVEAEREELVNELTGESLDTEDRSLAAFMQQISLVSDTDSTSDEKDYVSLMTIHASKGLEFKHVFIVGMEENIFPSLSALASMQEMEEERRLFYVAMTRAKSSLCLTCACTRYEYGQLTFSEPSRFIRDIDPRFLAGGEEKEKRELPKTEKKMFPWMKPSSDKKPMPLTSLKHNALTKKTAESAADKGPLLAMADMEEGMQVLHDRFGRGVIVSLNKDEKNGRAVVDFEQFGQKTLVLLFAKLRKSN